MPPQCGSLDGPVVTAARHALEAGDVDVVPPYIEAGAEDEIRAAFGRTLPLLASGGDAAALARLWFFETVVRLHRAGEHAPYTGLKPPGLEVGPVIPLAERAVETGDAEPVFRRLATELHDELGRRLEQVKRLAVGRDVSVAAGRAYVEEMLGLQVYAHHVHEVLRAKPHEDEHVDERAAAVSR